MSQLPLRIRTDIRDIWESTTSQTQTAVKKLSDDLGLPVELRLEWREVLSALKPHFGEGNLSSVVPTIAACVTVVLGRLGKKLEDDNAAADYLLEKLESMPVKSLVMIITTHDKPTSLSMLPKTKHLQLALKQTAGPALAPAPHVLTRLVDDLFSLTASSAAEEESEWADISSTPNTTLTPTTSTFSASLRDALPASAAIPPTVQSLPTVHTLLPPKLLFAGTLPYLMQITSTTNCITICCSHQKSLETLMEYVSNYLRTNFNDSRKPPMLKLELQESYFVGPLCDTLVITPFDERYTRINLNPVLILSLVEGVLGYRREEGSSGSYGSWMYRRDTAFRA